MFSLLLSSIMRSSHDKGKWREVQWQERGFSAAFQWFKYSLTGWVRSVPKLRWHFKPVVQTQDTSDQWFKPKIPPISGLLATISQVRSSNRRYPQISGSIPMIPQISGSNPRYLWLVVQSLWYLRSGVQTQDTPDQWFDTSSSLIRWRKHYFETNCLLVAK